jgi:hypothetical protein
MEIYIDDETYDRLVTALVLIEQTPHGEPDESAIKIALGEIADIWPQRYQDEAA